MSKLFSKIGLSGVKPIFIGAILTAFSVPAHAQFAHFARDAAMTPEDIALAADAAEMLYTKSGIQPGEARAWANAESGASGIVEVLAVEDGGACVVLRHLATTNKKPEIRYYLRRCLDANGNWVLSAN